MQSVILVNEKGESIGVAEKGDAHTGAGMLHWAFSVYVFRSAGSELLLQKRTEGKLFGGLWSNTCCSHACVPEGTSACRHAQVFSEDIVRTAEHRLQEEMGFSCPLREAGSFVYRAEDPQGHGTEHEYDTILVGVVDDADVEADPAEVADWRWMHIDDLTEECEKSPRLFTPWLAQGLAIAIGSFRESLTPHLLSGAGLPACGMPSLQPQVGTPAPIFQSFLQ